MEMPTGYGGYAGIVCAICEEGICEEKSNGESKQGQSSSENPWCISRSQRVVLIHSNSSNISTGK